MRRNVLIAALVPAYLGLCALVLAERDLPFELAEDLLGQELGIAVIPLIATLLGPPMIFVWGRARCLGSPRARV